MTDRIFTLSVRTKQAGGALNDRVVSTPTAVPAFNGRLIVMVHGYNNSQKVAYASYEIFRKNLSAAFHKSVRGGTGLPDIVHFYWPGDTAGIFDAIFSAGGYSRALEHAQTAATMLAEFFATSGHPPTSITFLGHSMGCRLILEALRYQQDTSPPVHGVALQAAAVGDKMFSPGHALARIGKVFARVSHVYYSSSDWVLRGAYPPGQLQAYVTRVEDAYYGNAIGRFGPPNGFHAHKTEMKKFGHSDYWGSTEMAEKFSTMMHKARSHYVTTHDVSAEPRRVAPRNLSCNRSISQ